jgi:cell wall-associated NlpC family hydrolase
MNNLILGLILLIVCAAGPAFADQIFAPPVLWDRGIASKTDPVDLANTHLGIPYRDDGALDHQGYFTTFDRPDRLYDTPGLNCSGLVVSVSRFLFNKNWTLDEATRDRLNDSIENSSLGKDWDFGWDLVLNLTEGRGRRIIMPDGKDHPVEGANGSTLRGFDLSDQAAWQKVLPQMRPGRVYLASISRSARDRGYQLLHYHVVLILPDTHGGIWLYHATRRSQVHKMNINTPQGMNRFMSQFKNSRGDTKKILIAEALLPRYGVPTETALDKGPLPEVPSLQRPSAQETQPLAAVDSPDSKPAPSETRPDEAASAQPLAPRAGTTDKAPELVINHLSGKVYKAIPEMLTHIPTLSDASGTGVRFKFANRGNDPKELEIIVKGPDGELRYKGSIPPQTYEASIIYPKDFGRNTSGPLRKGEYLEDVRVDGAQWCANLFEIDKPREAQPKIISVKAPATVESGKSFTVRIEAQNQGAESDYGGITVSCPESSGLKLVSAKPGRIYGPGSTVLSVTTDRIKTKVPMAERWIELWGEGKVYDLSVQIQAGRPGTYPLYIRCALRGVNVKSSLALMDPASAQTVDQQGFPVYVHQITVR